MDCLATVYAPNSSNFTEFYKMILNYNFKIQTTLMSCFLCIIIWMVRKIPHNPARFRKGPLCSVLTRSSGQYVSWGVMLVCEGELETLCVLCLCWLEFSWWQMIVFFILAHAKKECRLTVKKFWGRPSSVHGWIWKLKWFGIKIGYLFLSFDFFILRYFVSTW